MMRRLYDWMMRLAGHKRASHGLFWVSFIESSVFPIPPDVMLIPMCLANRVKAWRFAAICTLASVLGGVAGYAIGYFLLEYIGQPLLDFYKLHDKWAQLGDWFKEWGVGVVLVGGLTPFPYKLVTIFGGAMQMNLLAFVVASVVARGMRFYLVAGLIYWFGEPIQKFIERWLNVIAIGLTIGLILVFVLLKQFL